MTVNHKVESSSLSGDEKFLKPKSILNYTLTYLKHTLLNLNYLVNLYMASIKSGYDLSTATYSPEGRVFQIEYATKLVKNSPMVLGIISNDGILIFSEKDPEVSRLSLFSPEKIFPINKISAIGATGKTGDINYLIQRARIDNLSYRENFSESLNGSLLASRVASLIHMHTVYWHLRPFACSGIIGTISDSSPEIFVFFPSGLFVKCFGTAIGKQSETVKISLENILVKSSNCRKNIKEVSKALKIVKPKLNLRLLEIFSLSRETSRFDKPISCNIITENERLSNFYPI
mmetsp:Transcript_14083/g.22186  ORF Transcript_14083/g.22186 Transcript_14083/m.22186 type:complete len:289 (-) Transcript_14083:335-1201(-)